MPSGRLSIAETASTVSPKRSVSNCWSAWRLVDHHPDLHARAHFALSRKAVRAWAIAGIVCGLVLIIAGIGADWRPYAVLGVWFAIGLAYWVARGQRMSRSMRSLQAEAAPRDIVTEVRVP